MSHDRHTPLSASGGRTLKARIAIPVAAFALLAIGLFASPAQAQIDTYRVILKNGNTFTSAQRPQIADFDETKVVIRSLGGHIVALELDDIDQVESDLEFLGFGTLINKTTVLVGQVANDAIEPDPGDPNAALAAGQFLPNLSNILINQPFFGGNGAQSLSDAPFTSGNAGSLEAQVYDIP